MSALKSQIVARGRPSALGKGIAGLCLPYQTFGSNRETNAMQHAVLLVDDDQSILHGLARALRRQPYRLYTAMSGEEAVSALKSQKVDVIVSDEHMPGMCGADLMAWVANHCPEVMRIVLTGHPTVESAVRAINEGRVYQFFTKPCDPVLLGLTIRKALEHKNLLRETNRLTDVNRRQEEMLEHCGQELEILTRVLSQDLQEPLRQLSDVWRSTQELFEHRLDPPLTGLIERALDGSTEIRRLADALKRRCLGMKPAGGARKSDADGSTAWPLVAPMLDRPAETRSGRTEA